MELTATRSDDGPSPRTTLGVVGFIDISNSRSLVDGGLGVLDAGESLALDLSGVDFMDSTGISALVELALAARREGREFAVTATSAPVRRVLELTGLSERWPAAQPSPLTTRPISHVGEDLS